MYPPLPGEVHQVFGQSGAHYRQRVHFVRAMLRRMSAKRKRNFVRSRKGESPYSVGDPVYVSLAPSFIANYENIGIKGMRKALKKLGFFDVEETAIGATIVKNEYERMVKDDKRDVIITSCCHSVNLLIQKYYQNMLPYLADVLSPMLAHARDIKTRNAKAKVVFVGPCVSKKDEADFYEGYVDAVLTFEELTEWLKDAGIAPESDMDDFNESRARFFPTTGGILKTMALQNDKYTYMAVDGVENCKECLKDIESGNVHNCFIEMSACVGSCVGGPVMEKYHRSPVKDYTAVARYAGDKDFSVNQPEPLEIRKHFVPIEHTLQMPSEAEINAELREMGKYRKEDELNCGSCGYNTCREKAIAVLQGKAEISMCLPYLKDKAESFSDCIVNNTPNGLFVLNENLEVQQINAAARKIMNLRSASDILGEPVVRIMDPAVFLQGFVDKTQRPRPKNLPCGIQKIRGRNRRIRRDVSPSHLHNARRHRRGNRARKERKHLAPDNRNRRQGRRQANARRTGNRVASWRDRGGNQNRIDEIKGINRQ